jgi:hypothetical protein
VEPEPVNGPGAEDSRAGGDIFFKGMVNSGVNGIIRVDGQDEWFHAKKGKVPREFKPSLYPGATGRGPIIGDYEHPVHLKAFSTGSIY